MEETFVSSLRAWNASTVVKCLFQKVFLKSPKTTDKDFIRGSKAQWSSIRGRHMDFRLASTRPPSAAPLSLKSGCSDILISPELDFLSFLQTQYIFRIIGKHHKSGHREERQQETYKNRQGFKINIKPYFIWGNNLLLPSLGMQEAILTTPQS